MVTRQQIAEKVREPFDRVPNLGFGRKVFDHGSVFDTLRHLVFATVRTVSAASTVDRIVSVFTPGQQQQVRSTLADSACKSTDSGWSARHSVRRMLAVS